MYYGSTTILGLKALFSDVRNISMPPSPSKSNQDEQIHLEFEQSTAGMNRSAKEDLRKRQLEVAKCYKRLREDNSLPAPVKKHRHEEEVLIYHPWRFTDFSKPAAFSDKYYCTFCIGDGFKTGERLNSHMKKNHREADTFNPFFFFSQRKCSDEEYQLLGTQLLTRQSSPLLPISAIATFPISTAYREDVIARFIDLLSRREATTAPVQSPVLTATVEPVDIVTTSSTSDL